MNEKSRRRLRKSKPFRNLTLVYLLPMSLAIFIMGTILFVWTHFLGENQRASKSYNCSAQVKINLRENQKKPIPPNPPVQLTYNAVNPPPFKSDRRLQGIVDGIVSSAKSRGLPIERLSISLVDLSASQSQCCAYASYLDDRRRYPASVVKLFWMVALFGQYQAGVISTGTIPETTLAKMIEGSDNEAASIVLDAITNTESGGALPPETIKVWQSKRYSLNKFFEMSGYSNINISQKTFPIPFLKMNGPAGRDLQLRDKNLQIRKTQVNPIRNYLTTYSVARLLYEIRTDLSISEYYSNKMDFLLRRDLRPDAWQNKPYNAIEGFLGEYLPENAHLASKMGWTFSNRNDAAIIASPDRKTHYILVVFGDHPSFYKDKKFLPEISQLVYQQMTNYNGF